jgi:CubicO group peptidase (beta-lactamase class C family)
MRPRPAARRLRLLTLAAVCAARPLAAQDVPPPPRPATARPTAAPSPLRRLDGTTLAADSADVLARRLVAEHAITGLQVAVVNGGRLAWTAAYGVRARGDGAGSAPPGADLPMQRTTTTWAASITKAVFATYVMQLVEQGRFDLDAPVARQLPQPLDAYAPYREKAALVVHDSAWGRVTPRMLLSHTGGLLNFASMEPDGRMRLHDAPGTRYRYSGEGINLVQFLVEQRLGRPLDALMQEALFGPLGMARTSLTFRPELADDIADRFGADGRFLAKTRRHPARAAGSMTSTAGDLAAFAIALMDGRVLRAATRDAMLAPRVRITARTQFGSGSETTDGDEARRLGLAYGLGWGLLTRTPDGPAFFKEGHGDGAQTYLLCYTRPRSCLALLANSDNGELAFRPLVNALLGTDAVPWTWEGYTPAQIRAAQQQP